MLRFSQFWENTPTYPHTQAFTVYLCRAVGTSVTRGCPMKPLPLSRNILLLALHHTA